MQGVGFRMFVEDEAERLGLTGYVRNDQDDRRRVEVVAEGSKADLEELLRALQDGPPAARVEAVQTYWEDGQGTFTRFRTTV